MKVYVVQSEIIDDCESKWQNQEIFISKDLAEEYVIIQQEKEMLKYNPDYEYRTVVYDVLESLPWEDTEDEKIPFFAISNEQIKNLSEIGKFEPCPLCKINIEVKHSDKGEMSYINCPKCNTSRLVAIDGKKLNFTK